MRRSIFLIVAAFAAFALAGCGSTPAVPSSDTQATNVSQTTVAIKKPATSSKLSMPSGLKKVTYQKQGAGLYPVQFWFEPLGVQDGEYLTKVHVVGIKKVSHFALYLSRDENRGLVPRIVSGASISGQPTPSLATVDFAGEDSDEATFTVAYSKSLAQPNTCVSIQGWMPASDAGSADRQVSNGRVLCPDSGLNG